MGNVLTVCCVGDGVHELGNVAGDDVVLLNAARSPVSRRPQGRHRMASVREQQA